MKRLSSLTLAASILFGCRSATSGLCTNDGDPAGLTIALRDAMGPQKRFPRAGAYTFTLTTERGEVAWSCTVAADQEDGAGCVGTHDLVGGDDDALLITAASDEDDFTLALVVIEPDQWSGPDELRVVIERDGEQVVDRRFAPKYTLSPFAGGEGCPRYYVVDGDAPTIDL